MTKKAQDNAMKLFAQLPAFMDAYGKAQEALLPKGKWSYAYWEWQQGVGLFCIWELYQKTHDETYLKFLETYYDACIQRGLPGRNVNTTAPILALSFLAEHTGNPAYLSICTAWAEWIMTKMTRTPYGGIQHRTSDSENTGELWDDTLMMTVLPLANVGRILHRQEYLDEASYQFLLHTTMLSDAATGLWYHGYSFPRKDHFAGALWGRGNCWVTISILWFLEIAHPAEPVSHFLIETYKRQVSQLLALQDPSGMWHTLLDHPDSYLEASATAGFGYGFLKGVKMGIIGDEYAQAARKAVDAICGCVDDVGIVQQVSGGTPMGRDSQDFYRTIPIEPMPYGQSLAALFLNEAWDWD